jgi:hypothetical protein
MAAALALGGCNVVQTTTPLYTAADAKGAPLLKPGLWRTEGVCARQTPPSPTCVEPPLMVSADRFSVVIPPNVPAEQRNSEIGRIVQQGFPYELIATDPLVLQTNAHGPDTPGGPATDHYVYAVLEPLERDPDGRIIAAQFWLVQCGPAPKPGDANYGASDDEHYVTNHPLPGLTMVGEMCAPRDRKAFEAAAKAGRSLSDTPYRVRRVQDAPAAP